MANEKKRKFWDERACLCDIAGTNDFILKGLELDLLKERILENVRVLDVGCGNGETLIALAREKGCTGVGVDFSGKMITSALEATKELGLEDRLVFLEGTIQKLPRDLGLFDCALTERSLINLKSESEQHKAFLDIMSHVESGGRYFMIESSIDGLERINEMRKYLGLERIDPPWHNVFLREETVEKWASDEYILEEMYPFSSTYYFLSRVVYAKIAYDKGEKLIYNSDINLVACKLPPIGNFGPTRLWQWSK